MKIIALTLLLASCTTPPASSGNIEHDGRKKCEHHGGLHKISIDNKLKASYICNDR